MRLLVFLWLVFVVNVFAMDKASSRHYQSCDVNRDGVVNIQDVVYHNRCRAGLSYVSDPAILDADGDKIVSAADARFILETVTGNGVYTSVEGNSSVFVSYPTGLVSTDGQTMTKQYVKHTYKTNTDVNYRLTMASSGMTANDLIDTHYVFGDDTRTKAVEESVVYFDIRDPLKPNIWSSGTGFIIGDNMIITAAHCVYARETISNGVVSSPARWYNDKIYLTDSTGAVDESKTFTVLEAHIPQDYIDRISTIENDYALLVVDGDLSEYYHFSLGIPYDIYNNSNFENYMVYVTGFPVYGPQEKFNENPIQMYTGTGHIKKSGVNEVLFCFDADMTGGTSGGPVYVKEKVVTNSGIEEFNTVISICSSEISLTSSREPLYNCGPIINEMMLKFCYNNSYVG